jgi:hypothetical protein
MPKYAPPARAERTVTVLMPVVVGLQVGMKSEAWPDGPITGPEGLMNGWRGGESAWWRITGLALREGGQDGAAFGRSEGIEGRKDVGFTRDVHIETHRSQRAQPKLLSINKYYCLHKTSIFVLNLKTLKVLRSTM